MTRKELEQNVQAMVDGTLDEAAFEVLQAELRTNPDSRAFFRQSMEIELLLAETMRKPNTQNTERLLNRPHRKNPIRTLLAIAAVLVGLGTAAMFVMPRESRLLTLTTTMVPGTDWMVDGKSRNPASKEDKVVEGSTVSVLSGTLKLRHPSGAVMVLRGPATANFPTFNTPVLQHGWLWIDSGDTSETFEVKTPGLRVRDIGTRFGVRVNDKGTTEIHLVEGQVEVSSERAPQQSVLLNPTGEGILFEPSGNRSVLAMEQDPFPALLDLLTAQPNYRTTVLSQGPAGYWPLDDPDGERLANEIAEKFRGYRGSGAMLGEPGVGEGNPLMGFDQHNRSAYLDGRPAQTFLTDLDMPGGVSREEGGVAFWIRRLPGSARDEILWLAAETADEQHEKLGPRDPIMYTRLSASGRVEFFIENDDYDILLSSNFSVSDGGWHHVAASWGPAAAELYVDGRRVGRADDFGRLQQGIIRGRYVRFGKPTRNMDKHQQFPFTGWVDEIAAWNRPLTAKEVHHQFRAALGKAGQDAGNSSD